MLPSRMSRLISSRVIADENVACVFRVDPDSGCSNLEQVGGQAFLAY